MDSLEKQLDAIKALVVERVRRLFWANGAAHCNRFDEAITAFLAALGREITAASFSSNDTSSQIPFWSTDGYSGQDLRLLDAAHPINGFWPASSEPVSSCSLDFYQQSLQPESSAHTFDIRNCGTELDPLAQQVVLHDDCNDLCSPASGNHASQTMSKTADRAFIFKPVQLATKTACQIAEPGEVCRKLVPQKRKRMSHDTSKYVLRVKAGLDDYENYVNSSQIACELMKELETKDLNEPVLGYILAATASDMSFKQFKEALLYLNGNSQLKVPNRSAGFAHLVASLKFIGGAQVAAGLCRRLCYLRLHQFRRDADAQIEAKRAAMTNNEKRTGKFGKASTAALNMLVDMYITGMQAPFKPSTEEVLKIKTLIKNSLHASTRWLALCQDLSSGLICLVPQMAPTWFERAPMAAVKILANAMHTKRGIILEALAKCLSAHFEAILEGRPCALASAIMEDQVSSWEAAQIWLLKSPSCGHDGAEAC